MNPKALALVALLAGPAHADTWITEQITVSSVDSGQFITGGQTGHPVVTILEFATRDLCENFKATAAFLNYGVDVPMGTGSYFARVGAVFTECVMKRGKDAGQ